METEKVVRSLEALLKKVKDGAVDPERVHTAIKDFVGFQCDKTKDGWELVEDVEATKLLSVSQLELAPFLLGKESCISAEELVSRSKSMKANLGQLQAEYLLKHQNEIPEEWRRYYLVFPGTIWRGRYGGRNIPYLRWGGERWDLNFIWLDSGFGSSGRLLRPRE